MRSAQQQQRAACMPAGFDHAALCCTVAWLLLARPFGKIYESVRSRNGNTRFQSPRRRLPPDNRTAPRFRKRCTYDDFGLLINCEPVSAGIFSSQVDLDILGPWTSHFPLPNLSPRLQCNGPENPPFRFVCSFIFFLCIIMDRHLACFVNQNYFY
jgi:hypothetical protein